MIKNSKNLITAFSIFVIGSLFFVMAFASVSWLLYAIWNNVLCMILPGVNPLTYIQAILILFVIGLIRALFKN
jgi:hypothetical protein